MVEGFGLPGLNGGEVLGFLQQGLEAFDGGGQREGRIDRIDDGLCGFELEDGPVQDLVIVFDSGAASGAQDRCQGAGCDLRLPRLFVGGGQRARRIHDF